MVQRKIIFLLVFSIFFLSLVSSAPPTTTITDYQRGVDIVHPETPIMKNGSNLEFNFWTYNSSNGATLTNTSLNCTLYLIDGQGVQYFRFSNLAGGSGLIKYGKGSPLCVNCWTMTLPKQNISVGSYSYQIKCQGANIGGYTTGQFEVTLAGEELTQAKSILYAVFIALFFLLFVGSISGIAMLPSKDERGESGELISVGWIKYFRGTLFIVAHLMLIAITFLASNLAKGYFYENMFGNALFVVYQIFFWALIVSIPLYFIWVFYSIFKDRETKNMIERGTGFGDV